MAIDAVLATKVVAGTGIAGLGATGLYFGSEYINHSLSKYEVALINFLEADPDHDFVFTSDPTTLNLDFTTSSQTTKFSAKVQLSTSTNNLFKKGSNSVENDKLTEIKELNSGSWTWECEFTFSKKNKSDSINNIKDDFKNRIFKDTNKGLFGILKKDLSSYQGEKGKWTKRELKQVKIDFIKQCGYSRGISENKKINGESNTSNLKISVPEFQFIKEESNLIPEDKSAFNYWFKEEYWTKEYKTN